MFASFFSSPPTLLWIFHLFFFIISFEFPFAHCYLSPIQTMSLFCDISHFHFSSRSPVSLSPVFSNYRDFLILSSSPLFLLPFLSSPSASQFAQRGKVAQIRVPSRILQTLPNIIQVRTNVPKRCYILSCNDTK